MLRLLCLALALLAAPAAAAPRVAADIAPVHGLVARVMQGVAEPALVIPPGASPHDHALRPSEARALARADIVVWIGPALTPGLARALESLAPDAIRLALLEAEGTHRLALRDSADFGDAAAEGHDGHDGHGHAGAIDPHAWLDPENSRYWLGLIAETLAAADPANAAAYRANATAGAAEIAAASAGIAERLRPLADRPLLVVHDAFQYFESSFGLTVAGAISLGDATEPGPAHIAALRREFADTGIACIFAEPQFNPGLRAAVAEGTGARTAVLDPLGSHLTPGPGFYPALLEDLAQSVADCL